MEAVDLIQKPEPRYLGDKCPTCNNHSRDTNYIVFYILVGVLALVILLLAVTYFKYVMTHKEVTLCMELHKHKTEFHYKEEEEDDFYDAMEKFKRKKKLRG